MTPDEAIRTIRSYKGHGTTPDDLGCRLHEAAEVMVEECERLKAKVERILAIENIVPDYYGEEDFCDGWSECRAKVRGICLGE
jgi:hypothetical protein